MNEVEWMSAYLARNENILRKSLDNSVCKKYATEWATTNAVKTSWMGLP